MDKFLKTYDASLEVNEGKREVVAYISTNAIDRDGEVVQPKGLKKKNYANNPIVMVNHDYRSLPIGKALWVKANEDGSKLIAKSYISDKTELARDVFGLLQDGVLNAFSIGFVSLRNSAPTTQEKNARPELANARLIHREWELLEYSVVGIPANPEALTLAVSKGYSPETLDILSGKQAATELVAKEIEKAITVELKEKAPSIKELLQALENKANTIALNVDVEAAISKAFDSLKGRTR
jgi:HK97 family phage prohead protease